jgi:hypothetical protein
MTCEKAGEVTAKARSKFLQLGAIFRTYSKVRRYLLYLSKQLYNPQQRSPLASSYRAEMLGLCCLHLLARALSEYYQIQEWEATLCCDNKRALEQSAYTRRRIRPSAKCADIQRSLKATKHTLKGKFTYLHVYGHVDKYLLWHQCHLYSN